MNASSFTVLNATLLGLCFAATAPEATTQDRQRTHVVGIGNDDIGLQFRGWARARNTGGTPRVDMVINSPLKFLGQNLDLSRVAATALQTSSRFSGSYAVRVGPWTRSSGSVGPNGRKRVREYWTVFPYDPSQTFMVAGFIPVTVQGNAGYSADLDMTFVRYANSSRGVGLSGEANSYAYGWASAGIGWARWQVGVEVQLQFGEQTMEGYLGATLSNLSTRWLTYRFTPVRLLLRAFAELWPFGRHTKEIVNRRIGSGQVHSPFIR